MLICNIKQPVNWCCHGDLKKALFCFDFLYREQSNKAASTALLSGSRQSSHLFLSLSPQCYRTLVIVTQMTCRENEVSQTPSLSTQQLNPQAGIILLCDYLLPLLSLCVRCFLLFPLGGLPAFLGKIMRHDSECHGTHFIGVGMQIWTKHFGMDWIFHAPYHPPRHWSN